MKFTNKIVATVVATTIAASTMSVSAFAHDPKNHKGPGILPFAAGPIAAAAIAGPTASTFTWFTTQQVFSHYKTVFSGWKWVKIHHHWVKVPEYTREAVYKDVKVKHSNTNKSIQGKVVVGCIMGSAFGAITASIRKATALGNPPRWRSQAEHEKIVASGIEKKYELTNDEAQMAIAACGLGSLALHWQK